ncbi:MAG: FimV family protein [Ramlibacter sp.]
MKPALKLRHTVAGGILLLAAVNAFALTLGKPRGAVLIGQPLNLAVQVRLDPSDEVSSACFEADVFHADNRVSGTRVSAVFEPGTGGDGVVRVRSSALVDEPVVTVYLRAGCSQKVTRRYVLLADIPSDVQVPAQAAAAAVQATPVSPAAPLAPAAPPVVVIPGPSASAAAPVPQAATAQAAAPARQRPSRASPAPAKSASARPAPAKPDKPARAPRQARLKLEPLDLLVERDPTLKATAEMQNVPPVTDEQRAQAAALWRALNAQPQDVLRDTQRLQALEADVRGLRDQTVKNQASLGALRAQLQQAENERYANGLVYALVVALALMLALAAYLWQRGRTRGLSGRDWWRRSETAGGELDELEPDSLVAPLSRPAAGPAQRAVALDVDLDVDESMFSTLKAARPVIPAASPAPAAAARRPPDSGPNSDFVASVPGSARAVNVEELFDIQQQADFFVSLGQHDQAIEVLRNHIGDNTRTSALTYLDLLKIYHSIGRRDDYDLLRDDFNKVFNAQVPVFDAFSDQSSGLEAYHNALARIEALWPSPKVLEIIEESIFRKPDQGGEAFDLEAYRELLLLYAMAKDVVERGGAAEFELSGASQGVRDSQPSTGFSHTNILPLSASLDSRNRDSVRDSQPGDEAAEDALPEIPLPKPSPRLGLDIDLSEPAPLSSAFMEIGKDEAPPQERPEHPSRISESDSQDSGKPQDSNLIDFDLFDAATERDIAPKRPPRR